MLSLSATGASTGKIMDDSAITAANPTPSAVDGIGAAVSEIDAERDGRLVGRGGPTGIGGDGVADR